MVLMCSGLFLFFLSHLIPELRGLRRFLFQRYGAETYRTWISTITLIAFAQIIWGKATADEILIWQPPDGMQYVTIALMPVAVIFLTASVFPCNIRRFVLHPMLSGVALLSALHLFIADDLASIVLFAFFLLFSLYKQWVVRNRWPNLYYPPLRVWTDVVAVGMGLVFSYALYDVHALIRTF